MLQTAVQPVETLASVEQAAERDRTKTGRAHTYDQYCSLLILAAVVYNQSSTRRVREDPRVAQVANIMPVLDHDDCLFTYVSPQVNSILFEQEYYYSTLAPLLLAQRGHRPIMGRQDRVSIPKQRWSSISLKARTQWDGLPNKDKATILVQSDETVPVHQRPPDQRTVQQRANLTDMSAIDLLQAFIHDTDDAETEGIKTDTVTLSGSNDAQSGTTSDEDTNLLINAMISGSQLCPGDIQRVLSSSKSSKKSPTREVTMHMVYHAGVSDVDTANGSVTGIDVRIIPHTSCKADIFGIDNHSPNDIHIGTVGGVVDTDHHGPVILILNQYALLSKGRTTHSPGQLEWYGNDVKDKSSKIGGLQRIETHDGYIMPLLLDRGLPGMRIRPLTDDEFESLPHIILMNESPWDPGALDFDPHDQPRWFETIDTVEHVPASNLYDEFGEHHHHVTVQCSVSFARMDTGSIEDIIECCIYDAYHTYLRSYLTIAVTDTINDDHDTGNDEHESMVKTSVIPRVPVTSNPNFNLLRPMFVWLDPKTAKPTLQHSTRLARLPMGTMMKRAFKSQNPALNVVRQSEPVACVIVYYDTPAIDDGSLAAVLFVGLQSKVTDCYGIKADQQSINTLEDNIRERGAPTKLISDRALVENNEKVKAILRTLFSAEWHSEPHLQQQNPAERPYQTIKNRTNVVLDRSGAPKYTWLLALQYVCFILNHCYDPGISSIPLTLQTGLTIDTSTMLCFHFYQKVYYQLNETESGSKEALGHMVGFYKHVGSALYYKTLTIETIKVIPWSQVHPCTDDGRNLRVGPTHGEDNQDDNPVKPVIQSAFDTAPELNKDNNTTGQSNETLPGIGKTLLLDLNNDGTVDRAQIVELLEDFESTLKDNPKRTKFKVIVSMDRLDEMIPYVKLMDYFQGDDGSLHIYWKLKHILSHKKVAHNHPDYNGSQFHVMAEWENGEVTSEPLKITAKSDPITCTTYAKEINLMDQLEWKLFKPKLDFSCDAFDVKILQSNEYYMFQNIGDRSSTMTPESKSWSYKDVWQCLEIILCWKGDTTLIENNGG